MNYIVIPPVLKKNPLNLSQGVVCIRKPRDHIKLSHHNFDFSENVSSGIRCIFCSKVIFIDHIYSSKILTTSYT